MADNTVGPLLWLTKSRPEINRAAGLETVVRGLDPSALVAEYRHDEAVAPRRPGRGKRFFVEGHSGLPASGPVTNRNEEHLMLALFGAHRQGGRLARPGGERLRVIAYQVPLKARQSDPAGKVDGVALLDDGTVCLVELKAPTGRGDSPLRAMLECLSYAAVIEANRPAFNAELNGLYPEAAVGDGLVALVLGPAAWWQAWESCTPAGQWKPALRELCGELADALELTIAFAALDGFELSDLEPGLDGAAPVLRRTPQLADVPGLPALPSPQARPVTPHGYVDDLLATMHGYARARFALDRFDSGIHNRRRPPVFLAGQANDNLITPRDEDTADAVVAALTVGDRHRWFASMRSSQALTQSVFAGLSVTGRLSLLGDLPAECGRLALAAGIEEWTMALEKQVSWLSEPRPTSVDVWFAHAGGRIAVECKLSETAFGRCSRPGLSADHSSYCDGTYTHQRGRGERCALTEIGIGYWRHIPELLDWTADQDRAPCPLDWTYQLVRNVLAATVRPDVGVTTADAHALVVYDARNPAFASNGDARRAFDNVSAALRRPEVLRIVSWQTILSRLAHVPDLSWLVDGMAAKYGLTPRPAGSGAASPIARSIRDEEPGDKVKVAGSVGGGPFVAPSVAPALVIERVSTPTWLDTPAAGRDELDAVLGEQAEWGFGLPLMYRALASPLTGEPMLAAPRPGDDSWPEALAYWTPLVHLLVYSLGWARPDRGLRWWYNAGKPVDDLRLKVISAVWDADGQLDWFAAWVWTRQFAVYDAAQLAELTGYRDDGVPVRVVDDWIEATRADAARSGVPGPLVGSDGDALHLSGHSSGPLRAPTGNARLLRGPSTEGQAALILDSMSGWYHALCVHGRELPPLEQGS